MYALSMAYISHDILYTKYKMFQTCLTVTAVGQRTSLTQRIMSAASKYHINIRLTVLGFSWYWLKKRVRSINWTFADRLLCFDLLWLVSLCPIMCWHIIGWFIHSYPSISSIPKKYLILKKYEISWKPRYLHAFLFFLFLAIKRSLSVWPVDGGASHAPFGNRILPPPPQFLRRCRRPWNLSDPKRPRRLW